MAVGVKDGPMVGVLVGAPGVGVLVRVALGPGVDVFVGVAVGPVLPLNEASSM